MSRLPRPLTGWRSSDESAAPTSGRCSCTVSFDRPGDTPSPSTAGARPTELHVDATDCSGDLADSPACRATVVGALADRDADLVAVRSDGLERVYTDDAAGLLLAAGRFADLAAAHDPVLAARVGTDPLAAGREAAGRAGPIAEVAAETGLAEGAARFATTGAVLRAHTGPAIAAARIGSVPRSTTELRGTRDLATGATAAVYGTETTASVSDPVDETAAADAGPVYHVRPLEAGFDAAALSLLDRAATVLADGDAGDGRRAPARAVRLAADQAPQDRRGQGTGTPLADLAAVLRKHTRGNGVLDDLFADERVSDVYVTAPTMTNPVRVVVDGETMPTNVRLRERFVGALASRVRRVSGRAFSRASPSVDAVLPAESVPGGVRVAGVRSPLSDGPAFALRRHDETPWTLARLVRDGTIPPRPAGLLALAVDRGVTGLVAGGRGAGKTTFLGALCHAVPPRVRTVLVEDTPELPVAALQSAGRDVQALRVGTAATDGNGSDSPGETTPAEALRTALRLGEGALVVGEVRGEEASVLYEAMRVGAAGGAVLGTIHGEGAAAVRERVVSDLGVPESSFSATRVVVTCSATGGHHVARIEEVRPRPDGTTDIVSLFETDRTPTEDGLPPLRPTGILDRGDSVLLADLARPGETYTDVLAAVETRRRALAPDEQ